MEFKPTIGLEIHVELKTKTKMFCNSANDPSAEPNTNICPVCMGHPGVLPRVNKEAVKKVLTVGVAVGGTLADYTEFDRKNYFYPDIPKGYQISQYKHPLVSGGSIKGVLLTRIHLEEDTAKSSHESTSGSLVDFNRAGVPLMELVTEPVLHSGEEASAFAKELQLLLRTLGVSDANMERGEMRVEANISVSATDALGTKVEVKNLNSFKSVERAIEFEIKRHIEAISRGDEIVQETRGWDEMGEKTFSQRKKESAHDYRYFPDPDIPKYVISEIPEFSVEALKALMPELPEERRRRLDSYGIAADVRDTLTNQIELGHFFDEVIRGNESVTSFVTKAANYLTSDLNGLGGRNQLTTLGMRSLIGLLESGELSSRGAKDLLKSLNESGDNDAKAIATSLGLLQVNDDSLLIAIAKEVIAVNAAVVVEYTKGKDSSLQFLVGQGMKLSKGSANPQKLREAIISAVKS